MKLTSIAIMFLIGWFIGSAAHQARGADLPLSIHIRGGLSKPVEACLERNKEPAAGQTLQVDKRCKSGLRWVYQK